MADAGTDDIDLVETIRWILGLRPLPREPFFPRAYRFSLDGQRRLTASEWSAELGVNRQAIINRRQQLELRLEGGMAPSQAYALAMAPRVKLAKRWRKRRRQQNRSAA